MPDYPTQKKIGEFLHNLEKQICLNTNLISKYMEYINFLYDYWFLQFEFPNENHKPYFSNGGKMVFNEELKMNLPENWYVSDLKHTKLCTSIDTGIDVFEGNKKYLATADVDGISIFDGSDITYDNREGRANMQPVENSIWFAKMKNSIKHIAVTPSSKWLIKKYVFSTGFTGLKCENQSFAYLWSYISNPIFETIKDMRSSGSTQEGINDEDLCLFPLIVPEQSVLNRYNELVVPAIEKIYALVYENKKLEEHIRFMLPLLINGQVSLD